MDTFQDFELNFGNDNLTITEEEKAHDEFTLLLLLLPSLFNNLDEQSTKQKSIFEKTMINQKTHRDEEKEK